MRILSAVLSHAAIDRILDHLGIPRPRAPNPHDCQPPPGAQLVLPTVRPPSPEVARDPRLSDDWPVDAPFEGDLAS